MIRSLALALHLLVSAFACTRPASEILESRASAVEALAGGDASGYALATEPRELVFPRDHGPHPDFKTEWWYFTGHLKDTAGRRFGYQLTFFRQAVAPGMSTRSSAWATRQLYLAHFALTDIDGGSFRAFEHFSRGAAGLAGAGESHPFQVWLEDWSVKSLGDEAFPVRLQATSTEGEPVALDLTLASTKPIVLHGQQGLSRKGVGEGNASYYYSLTRLSAHGRLTLGDRHLEVNGSSWLDREWSTSVLSKDQVGWDWFSLQLDDRRELMFFQLRLADGSVDPARHGTLIDSDGSTRSLHLADIEIAVLDSWNSARGITYPALWRLMVPSDQLDLILTPLFADQELNVSFRYWEGAIGVSGTYAGQPIRGQGYVELVGYGD